MTKFLVAVIIFMVLFSNANCGPVLYAACRAACYSAHTACIGLLTFTTGPGKLFVLKISSTNFDTILTTAFPKLGNEFFFLLFSLILLFFQNMPYRIKICMIILPGAIACGAALISCEYFICIPILTQPTPWLHTKLSKMYEEKILRNKCLWHQRKLNFHILRCIEKNNFFFQVIKCKNTDIFNFNSYGNFILRVLKIKFPSWDDSNNWLHI